MEWVWKDGSLVKNIATLAGDQSFSQHPYHGFTIICNSISKGFDAIFWFPWAPCINRIKDKKKKKQMIALVEAEKLFHKIQCPLMITLWAN